MPSIRPLCSGLAAVLLVAATDATAQEPGSVQEQAVVQEGPAAPARPVAEPSETIDAFAGFQWGRGRADVEAALGPPPRSEKLESGITVLVYDDSVAGEPTIAMYALHDSLGLFKGQYVVNLPAPGAGDCGELYGRVRDHVKLLYPLLPPVEYLDNPTPDDFCTAAAAGEAGWVTQWRDEDTGTVVTVLVEKGEDLIKIVYESGPFLEWLHAQQEPEE